MGVMLSAAGSLRWLQAILGADYDVLTAEASAWAPTTEGLTFLPYLAGERTPHADPDARGAYTGLSLRHDRGALVRALLEGVAFGLRDSLDLIAELGGRPALGRVSGGGARSEEWLRIVASVLELPLERVAVEDAAAFGAALLGGRRRRRLAGRPGGGRGDRAPARADRAGARVDRALPRRARALPRPLPGAARMPLTPPADAAIFDFDGVIIDSLRAGRDGHQRRAARARVRAAPAPPRSRASSARRR